MRTASRNDEGERDRGFVKASLKLFEVLELYATRDKERAISLSDVVESLGYPKTTVHRLVSSLRTLGYLEKDETVDGYRLGPRFFALVEGKVSYQRLKIVTHPIMEKLVRDIEETVNLAVLDQNEIVLIDVVEGLSPFRWVSKPGDREPFYATATGKAIAAFLPATEVERLLEDMGMAPLTARTITRPESFLAELRAVRRDLVSFDDEETMAGVQCIASPVFGRGTNVVAALSVSGPEVRMAKCVSKIKPAVRDAAQKISQLMGYQIGKTTMV